MTRLQSDALLLLTALIWGAAFVVQKTGMEEVGPYTFIASRFIISAILVLPFAVRETRRAPAIARHNRPIVLAVAAAFAGAMVLQQLGIQTTSVTNAGFLTGLYVVMTPFVAWLILKRRPRPAVWLGALISMAGVYLLTFSSTTSGGFAVVGIGDAQIVASAALFALQISLLGLILPTTPRPITIMLIQSLLTVAVSLPMALATETITLAGLSAAAPEIAYAGILAGALGFSFQAIGQQYSPPSDAAIIMSSEAVWAAIAGAIFLNESLPAYGLVGCALILLAIILVELVPSRAWKTHSP